MNDPRRVSVVRDPVHGDLFLTQEEMALLDTRAMQRLRGVRQLGTAYLVFPGAQHTRFEHSLGTVHLTGRLIEAIDRGRRAAPHELLGVSDEEARILRAAALVHDVTHVPFGHNIEDQSGLLERHDSPERFAQALAPGTELGDQLDRMGIRREVLATLVPNDPDSLARVGEALPEIPAHWRELLSDTLCADIFDYLLRDAYYTGLNLLYDARVLGYFRIDRATSHLFVDVVKRGLVREDILSEIVRVLEARYFFSERVYYHHAKISAGAMIARCVEDSLQEGGLQPSALADQTDDSLLHLLDQHPPEDATRAARHRDLLERFRSRRLLKRACVFPAYANREVQEELVARFFSPEGRAEREALERSVRERLAPDSNGQPPWVILYCPAKRMQLKEVATHVRYPGHPAVRPLSELRDTIPRLDDLERSYRDLWKLYVLTTSDDPTVQHHIAESMAELLPNATNVYRPKAR